jgi:Flp pilus assembly protein TadB
VGAWFIKNRSRHFVAMFIYLSIAVQYIAAILIIPLDPSMLVFSIGVLAVGLLLFWFMARIGSRRLEANGDNVPS